MDYRFDYDFSRDYQKPNQWGILFQTIGGAALMMYGIIQVFSYLKMEEAELFVLGIGIIAMLGGLSFLLYAMNGYKPMVHRDSKFIKIKQGEIHFKLRKFAKASSLRIDDIRRVNFEAGEIILGLKDNSEIFIGITDIQNETKREEFISTMKAIKANR